MAHEYNNIIARHYAAYRPALHGVILHRLIYPGERFKIGLDVGCGTGYSTIALAEYSDRVFGLDPNQPMLNQAAKHPRISYINGYGNDLSIIGDNRFDIITFAGSLFYTKTNKLKIELLRTLAPRGKILIYDFQVFMDDLMESLEMNDSTTVLDYNFLENLDSWSEFVSESAGTDEVLLTLSVNQVAHLLLANSHRYQEFQKRFHKTDPFECLADSILQQDNELKLRAKIFFTRYRMAY